MIPFYEGFKALGGDKSQKPDIEKILKVSLVRTESSLNINEIQTQIFNFVFDLCLNFRYNIIKKDSHKL